MPPYKSVLQHDSRWHCWNSICTFPPNRAKTQAAKALPGEAGSCTTQASNDYKKFALDRECFHISALAKAKLQDEYVSKRLSLRNSSTHSKVHLLLQLHVFCLCLLQRDGHQIFCFTQGQRGQKHSGFILQSRPSD